VTSLALGGLADSQRTLLSKRVVGGRYGRHLEGMTSIDANLLEPKILPNFTQIRFETMEPMAFSKSVTPTTTTRMRTIYKPSIDTETYAL